MAPVDGSPAGVIDPGVSPPARIAAADEGISIDELRLATRTHGMPLEMLALDVSPAGLHYVLVHYDIPVIDPASYRLRIDGAVRRPIELDLAALRARPQETRTVTLECAGNGRARLSPPRAFSQPWLDEAVGTARWTGTPLAPLLAEAGALDTAVDVVFSGADHGIERGVEQDYQRALAIGDARDPDVLVVHAMNDEPLPPQHGAPVRLIVPGWYGMAHVKWLVGITVLERPFTGYQNAVTYRVTQDVDDPGEAVTRILPRALLAPPGFPDFQTRTRIVERGVHELGGRAWSGQAAIARVEVSDDGGATWHAATVEPAPERHAWCRWRWTWAAERTGPGELCVRATDEAGNTQPVDQRWNRQAMANNHVQRVAVYVR